MRKLANTSATNTAQEQSDVYWWRVSTYTPASGAGGGNPAVALDGAQISVDSLTYAVCALDKPWRRIETVGTITVEFGDNPREPFPGPVNSGGNAPSTDGARAAAVTAFSDVGGITVPALYDQLAPINTAIDTGILDFTGYRDAWIQWVTTGGTTAPVVKEVDDNGNDWPGAPGIFAPVASSGAVLVIGMGCSVGAGASGGFAVISVSAPLPRRLHITVPSPGIGNQVRLRVWARR